MKPPLFLLFFLSSLLYGQEASFEGCKLKAFTYNSVVQDYTTFQNDNRTFKIEISPGIGRDMTISDVKGGEIFKLESGFYLREFINDTYYCDLVIDCIRQLI